MSRIEEKQCPFQVVPTPHQGKENCCGIIFGSKPCNLKKLLTPLEMTFPKIFGDFDEQQERLQQIAPPVNILENAADFIRCIKDLPNILENIINKIIDDNKSDFVFLGSEVFPFLLKNEEDYKYEQKNLGQSTKYSRAKKSKEEYDDIIAKCKDIVKQTAKEKYILHAAVNLGESGGHYAIIIKNNKDFIVYDSMQQYSVKKKQSSSYYSAFFSQIAMDIFGASPSILPHTFCTQPTGGFVQDEEDDYQIQDIDSQNHFCYMWSIWYFHIVLTKGMEGVNKIMAQDATDNLSSIIYIKKYIWSIIMYMYPSDKTFKDFIQLAISTDRGIKITNDTADFLMRFFLMNFRYIWFDCVKGKFNLYSIIDCDISKFRRFTNINESLEYSLHKEPLVLDSFTS
jgi:hypothetical protein